MIVCRDVHKWYGRFHALKGVGMTVHKGEVVVICGPSGSGKSTFIRTINRLEDHQRGQIIVDGIELTHDVRNIEAIRREVGMVFQSFNLFPHLAVLRNIMVLMDDGVIVEESPPAEFFGNPRQERTRAFLSQVLQH
ncbi:MAG: ATP-binding cassette domain-containing protein [Candidatus Methylomirabilia bacterium]